MMRGNVKALVDQYADNIIKSMLAERKMGIKDFRTSLQPQFVKARTAVIRRLHAEGFTCYAICRILKLNTRTVQSRFNPRIQERKRYKVAERQIEASA